MDIQITTNHESTLSELRKQLIEGIKESVSFSDQMSFNPKNYTHSEVIYNQNGRVEYYGFRYKGYSDRYHCDLDDLTTDDLSEILTALEKLEGE